MGTERPILNRTKLENVLSRNTTIVAAMIVILSSYWLYTTQIQPISPYYQEYDGEFQYFMNSLNVFKGNFYFYVDHPGTPIEIIGSLIFGIMYPFIHGGREAFIQYQLQNPGLFFGIVRFFLTAASIGCALYFYQTFRHLPAQQGNDLLLAAAVALMYYAIHPLSFSTLTLWQHAAFNFPFGTSYLLILVNIAQRKDLLRPLTAALLGLGAGVLTAIMIYFGAWVVGLIIFIVLFYWTQKAPVSKTLATIIIIGGYSLIGFGLAMIPALNRIPYFIYWIRDLVTHQGMYGSGPAGFATPQMLSSNLADLARTVPALFIIMMIVPILFLYLTFRSRRQVFIVTPGSWALAAALIVQSGLLLLIDLKHPGSNELMANRYVLPLAATIPVCVMLVLQLSQFNQKFRRILGKSVLFLVFIGIAYFLPKSLIEHYQKAEFVSSAAQQTSHAIGAYGEETGRSPEKLNILSTYATFSPCYALWFGNDSAGNTFADEIAKICVGQNYLNIWNQSVATNKDTVNVAAAKWDLIITRKGLLADYPFLAQLGSAEEYLSSTYDMYGSFVLISKSH